MMDNNTVLRTIPLVLVLVLFLLAGCKKDQPEGDSIVPTVSDANQEIQNMFPPQESTSPETMEKHIVHFTEQTTCPVKDDPIDEAIFTEYQGKKVYFCCQECMDDFKADPEKYLVMLPQFAIQGSKTEQ